MKTIWRKEPKKYKIRWARSPQKGLYLSGIAIFYEEALLRGTIRIKFEEALIPAIGKHMPYGIGADHRAYLVLDYRNTEYYVWCKYLDNTYTLLLWKQKEKPSWCKGVKYER